MLDKQELLNRFSSILDNDYVYTIGGTEIDADRFIEVLGDTFPELEIKDVMDLVRDEVYIRAEQNAALVDSQEIDIEALESEKQDLEVNLYVATDKVERYEAIMDAEGIDYDD